LDNFRLVLRNKSHLNLLVKILVEPIYVFFLNVLKIESADERAD